MSEEKKEFKVGDEVWYIDWQKPCKDVIRGISEDSKVAFLGFRMRAERVALLHQTPEALLTHLTKQIEEQKTKLI